MLFKNKELEKQKEKERVDLIDKVVEDFFAYLKLVNEKKRHLKNISHHVISSTTIRTPQYSLRDVEKVFQNEEERNNILASHLSDYGNVNHYVSEVKEVVEEYENAKVQLKTSIEDLKHFYKITKYPSSKIKKVRALEKVLLPITIGDLKPLYELEGANSNIKVFKESHSFRFIEKYLEKDREGNYVVDKHNIYVVKPYYFSDRVNKLKSNIQRILESVQKNIWKITRKHKTKEQLRRYLQY